MGGVIRPCLFCVRTEDGEVHVNRMKLHTAFFAMALAWLLAPALVTAQGTGRETGNLPETQAPAATAASAQTPPAAAQAAQAPAQSAPATPATTPSGHPNNEYWRKHDQLLLTDFPWLAKFKADDLALGPPAAGEDRVVFMGDSITEGWHLDRLISGQALHQPRHQRADHAADGAALSPGRDRTEAEGSGHSGRHQRHRRKHGTR